MEGVEQYHPLFVGGGVQGRRWRLAGAVEGVWAGCVEGVDGRAHGDIGEGLEHGVRRTTLLRRFAGLCLGLFKLRIAAYSLLCGSARTHRPTPPHLYDHTHCLRMRTRSWRALWRRRWQTCARPTPHTPPKLQRPAATVQHRRRQVRAVACLPCRSGSPAFCTTCCCLAFRLGLFHPRGPSVAFVRAVDWPCAFSHNGCPPLLSAPFPGFPGFPGFPPALPAPWGVLLMGQ